MKFTHIDHNFYQVSNQDAGRLAKSAGRALPRYGYETCVELPSGKLAWLGRTFVNGKQVWAVHPTSADHNSLDFPN